MPRTLFVAGRGPAARARDFFDAMAEQMVNLVNPMWSQVVDNDEFDKMVEASPTASRKASAN